MQPLPQYSPGPAVRPSLSPEGRKEEARGRALRSLERDVWAGMRQLWYCATRVGPGERWAQCSGPFTLPDPRGFRKLARRAIVSLATASDPPSFPGARTAERLLCSVPATEDQTRALTLSQTKTHGSSGLGRAIGWPGCPLGVKHSLQSQDLGLRWLGAQGSSQHPFQLPRPQGRAGQLPATSASRPPSGWAGRALQDRQPGSMLPCCGLSTLLGRAVCQGVQVPAWTPAPSQGACRKTQESSW